MFTLPKSYWILTGSAVLLTFFALEAPTSFRIDEVRANSLAGLPKNLGDWSGEDTRLEEKVYEILETRNVLSRTYQNPQGEEVHLLIVGSHHDRRVAHPPEVCYLGSHFEIVRESSRELHLGERTLPVKTFVAKNKREPNASHHVLYLYKVGDRWTTNYYEQQLKFAFDRLRQKRSQVLLIRLVGVNPNLFPDLLSQVVSQLN